MTNNCTKGSSTKGYPAVGSERAAVNFAIQGSGAGFGDGRMVQQGKLFGTIDVIFPLVG